MTGKEVADQLEAITLADDVVSATIDLTEAWSEANVGVESIEPVVRFIEEHPELDCGSPGPLVHFVENLYLKGCEDYENKVVESVSRRPTILTVWMLNRIFNIIKEPKKRRALMEVMQQAASNPKIDKATLAGVQVFLE